MILFKVNNENHCDIRYLNQKYPNIVYGILGNKPVAVVSDYRINTRDMRYIQVEDEYKRPLWKVDMDMRMGKGFHLHSKKNIPVSFNIISKPENYQYFSVYRIKGGI